MHNVLNIQFNKNTQLFLLVVTIKDTAKFVFLESPGESSWHSATAYPTSLHSTASVISKSVKTTGMVNAQSAIAQFLSSLATILYSLCTALRLIE